MKPGGKVAHSARRDQDNRRQMILQRLAGAPEALARGNGVLPTGADARLTSLLAEIDETVLPRLLHLTAGSAELACLIVSQRRLIDVQMPGRPDAPNDSDTLTPLLAARLIELSQHRGALTLSATRRSEIPTQAEAAVSVAALSQALTNATTQTAFERLLTLADAQSSALLAWSPAAAQPQYKGPREWLPQLASFAGRFQAIERQNPADGRVGAVRTQGVAIPVSKEQLLLMASLDKNGFAAILPIATGLKLIAGWQAR